MDVPISRAWPALDVVLDDSTREDLVLALLDEFHPTAVDYPAASVLRAYFATAADRDAAGRALSQHFSVSPLDVPDEGWAERSQAALRAIHVGDLIVAPPWDMPGPEELARTIVIRPSMGFGTGHHATTRLCLRAMQTLSLEDKIVLDVGTGSGVLAIAAARLGAAHVLAIDVDPAATSCAAENVAVNGVSDCVTIATADLRDVRTNECDVLIANLTGRLLRASSERLLRLIRPGGHLILSGFVLDEEDEVAGAFTPPARMVQRDQEEEWGVLLLQLVTHEA